MKLTSVISRILIILLFLGISPLAGATVEIPRHCGNAVADSQQGKMFQPESENRFADVISESGSRKMKSGLLASYKDLLEKLRRLSLRVYTGASVGEIEKAARDNNVVIMRLEKFLADAGEQSKIVELKTKYEGKKIKYFALDLGKIDQAESLGLSTLDGLLKRAGVNRLLIDFIGSMIKRSGGSYNSKNNILTLAKNATTNLLTRDQIGYIVRHELVHALFDKLAERMRESLYHARFFAMGSTELFPSGIYRGGISAEELYNYINNMYWSTYVFLEPFSYSKSELSSHAGLQQILVDQLEAIASQVYQNTGQFLNQIDRIKSSKTPGFNETWFEYKGEFGLAILNKNRNMDFANLQFFSDNKGLVSFAQEAKALETALGIGKGQSLFVEGPQKLEALQGAQKMDLQDQYNKMRVRAVTIEGKYLAQAKSRLLALRALASHYKDNAQKLSPMIEESKNVIYRYSQLEAPTLEQEQEFRKHLVDYRAATKFFTLPARRDPRVF